MFFMLNLQLIDNKLNDCFVLNQYERICDATIANVFWIKDAVIYTTPLSEGGIAGVMRRWLMDNLSALGYQVIESILEPENLESSQEVFLTNAVYGLRWVKQFRNSIYSNDLVQKIYRALP